MEEASPEVQEAAVLLGHLQFKDWLHRNLESRIRMGKCNSKTVLLEFMLTYGVLAGDRNYEEGVLAIRAVLEERRRAGLALDRSISATDSTIAMLTRLYPTALGLSRNTFDTLMEGHRRTISEKVEWEQQMGLQVCGYPYGAGNIENDVQEALSMTPVDERMAVIRDEYGRRCTELKDS
jgi:hypothetical protein